MPCVKVCNRLNKSRSVRDCEILLAAHLGSCRWLREAFTVLSIFRVLTLW